MNWDEGWLRTVKDTKKLVAEVGPLLSEIPSVIDREIVTRQFHILNGNFRADVESGYHPFQASSELAELAVLIFKLAGY